MKNFLTYTFIILLVLVFSFGFIPATLHAQSDGVDTSSTKGLVPGCFSGGQPVPCESYVQLIQVIQLVIAQIVKWVLIFTVIPILWAGFLYMTSGDKPANRTEANKMLLNVVKGIVVIMSAWLIVTFIVKALIGNQAVLDLMPFKI